MYNMHIMHFASKLNPNLISLGFFMPIFRQSALIQSQTLYFRWLLFLFKSSFWGFTASTATL